MAGDILQFDEFFLPDDNFPTMKNPLKNTSAKGDSVELFKKFRDLLASAESFDAPTLEKLMHDFVEKRQIKIGQIIHAVRVAVTGKSTGLGMFDTLAILGKNACLARIDRTLEKS